MAPKPSSKLLKAIVNFSIQLGKAASQWKSTAGAASSIDARNAADSGYVNVSGADATLADHLVTLRQLTATGVASSDHTLLIPLTGTTGAAALSAMSLPAGTFIKQCDYQPLIAQAGITGVTVGSVATPDLLMDATMNTPNDLSFGLNEVKQFTPWPTSGQVQVSIAGTPPVAGGTYANVIVTYVTVPAS